MENIGLILVALFFIVLGFISYFRIVKTVGIIKGVMLTLGVISFTAGVAVMVYAICRII